MSHIVRMYGTVSGVAIRHGNSQKVILFWSAYSAGVGIYYVYDICFGSRQLVVTGEKSICSKALATRTAEEVYVKVYGPNAKSNHTAGEKL